MNEWIDGGWMTTHLSKWKLVRHLQVCLIQSLISREESHLLTGKFTPKNLLERFERAFVEKVQQLTDAVLRCNF